jgi:hypothetical protein
MSQSRLYTTVVLMFLTVILVMPTLSGADRPQEMFALPSDYYRQQWCTEHRGATEVRMADGSSADCITSTHVVQFQFAPKWTEAIGTALYYSSQTGKKAGIVIIIKEDHDLEYWKRLNATIEHFKLPIRAWKVE